MGRRNTQVEPDLPLKTKAKSLARVRSAGTLTWLGFDRAQPNRTTARSAFAMDFTCTCTVLIRWNPAGGTLILQDSDDPGSGEQTAQTGVNACLH